MSAVFDVAASAVGADVDTTISADSAITLGALASPLSFLGLAAGVKFMMWMQEGTPVVVTPLTLQGKPFMSASLGQKRTSFFMSLYGKWEQYWDDLENSWRKFDINEEIFDTALSIEEKFANMLIGGPGQVPKANE